MNESRKARNIAVALAGLLAASPAFADHGAGSLVGWVEDHRGSPIAGAIVSLFGSGIGTRGLIAFTDEAGRVVLSSLPAGSYTVRALGRGYRPAAARRIKILPDAASVFTWSLSPSDRLTRQEEEARVGELEWLLRHKQRSVLEDRGTVQASGRGAPPDADLFGRVAPFAAALGGSVDFLTNGVDLGYDPNASVADSIPTNLSVVRVGGRFGLGHWSLGGVVANGGAVESDPARWRMAAAFVIRPFDSHRIEADAGYGSPVVQPFSATADRSFVYQRGIGALALQETWEIGRVSTSLGTRYTYVGTLTQSTHIDPLASLSLRAGGGTTLRAGAASRTVIPGGDPLALSGLSLGPTVAFALVDPALRAERIARYEVGVDHQVGALTLGGHVFLEDVRDPLRNAFSPRGSTLRVTNVGARECRGLGISVSQGFGRFFRGSVAYTYGRSLPQTPGLESDTFAEADFHDVVARFETVIERSGTRLAASYRMNALDPDAETLAPLISSRFDVQLRQAIPFLAWLTRADWELLLAYRNLFYEPEEGALLDEVTVVNPPRRVVGGVSVRF